VDISGVTNATENGVQQATTSITDDDNPPTVTLSVDNVTIAEAAGVATFTATLSAASGLPVTVDLAFSGTATLTDDYTRSGVQITIPAGSTTGTVTVTAVQDALSEGDETVIVDITGVTNGTENGVQQATTTIVDDEGLPTVTLTATPSSIAEAAGVATFTATLSAASGLPVTVDLAFSGTATLTDDYTRSGVQITIPAGSTTGTITVSAVQDAIDENAETVIVDITGVTNATEDGVQQRTTSITDDDAAPTVTLSVDNATIAEAAGVATFTATLSAASGLPVTVDLAFSGTATLTDDYTRSGVQITIPAGSTTGTITVTAVQDLLDENAETIIVDISGVTNATENGVQQATTSITDDDNPPTVTLSVDTATIAEAAGVATFTATLSAASGLPVMVDLAFSGTATYPDDYARSAVQIVIPAGSITGLVLVTATPDLLDEANETVIVEIATVTNATEAGVQQQTTSILDDNAAPTDVILQPSTVREDANTSAGPVTVGQLIVTDPDTSAGGHTFELNALAADNVRFQMDGDTLLVRQGVVLDFESRPTFNVLVVVSDGANILEKMLTVHVEDVPESLYPWQNPRNRLDVNDDGLVDVRDMLAVVSILRQYGVPHILPIPLPGRQPPPFVDVDGNNICSPGDLLPITQFIRDRANQGQGEAEEANAAFPGLNLAVDGVIGGFANSRQHGAPGFVVDPSLAQAAFPALYCEPVQHLPVFESNNSPDDVDPTRDSSDDHDEWESVLDVLAQDQHHLQERRL
jgi:hypothetical protein